MVDVLLAKTVPLKIRLHRAQAILIIGKIFQGLELDPEQPKNEYYEFEELLTTSHENILLKK
jgi:hypothetical protein